ncbi:hypothetical protein COEREDRAFT_83722 [Coemansia reversa NRRL 1564]|uniref:C2 domain-containing protein n=1 Tax=Coemansia reversa (strain ATCC 12441 / NRRL 1564) TaxID=763665 RepID=A0A2G5B272_COERN|nr:hypothetical protein COEREDRAFT_83722 [Coemansia reversa NRRL 1564]|eukprot:PIA13095.1 hypothetical protein COEREDRAFT_83722 [Coemansia reversa NRRL 1564]
MYEFLYRVWLLGRILLFDYSRIFRPLFNWFDDWTYAHYRETSCYDDTWDKEAKPCNGIMRLEIAKGKDTAYSNSIYQSQYVLIRVGKDLDFCDPVDNNDGEPHFCSKSYFTEGFYTNTLVEISLITDGTQIDSVVGRVTIPLKELHDVRDYHGWLALVDNQENPVGYLFLSSRFRAKRENGYNELMHEANSALEAKGDDNEQYLRKMRGRNKDRAKHRRAQAHNISKSDDQHPENVSVHKGENSQSVRGLRKSIRELLRNQRKQADRERDIGIDRNN